MGVESYRVMLPDGLARAESMGMQLADSATIGDRTFVILESENVEVGGRVNFTMTGLPQPSLMQRAEKVAKSDGFQRGVLPGLAGLVFVGLVGFTLVRRRRASVAGEDGFEGVDDEHDDLILAIATLDERFESGDIEEEAYNQQRAELLEQIRNNSG
jgi:hypothetical protein